MGPFLHQAVRLSLAITAAFVWNCLVWFAIDSGFVFNECGLQRGIEGSPLSVFVDLNAVCAEAHTWQSAPGLYWAVGCWTVFGGWLLFAWLLARPFRFGEADVQETSAKGAVVYGGSLVLGVAASLVLLAVVVTVPDAKEVLAPVWLYRTEGFERGVVLLELVLLGPVMEELVFRGYLWRFFERAWGGVTAITLTTVLFTMSHGAGALGVVVLALWCAFLRARFGRTMNCIQAHVVYNAVVVATLLGILQLNGTAAR